MLHGIPVSVKDCFHVRGCDSTSGLTQSLFKPNDIDGVTVKVLRKSGAIPFCLTNTPQTMMGYQCSNPCFGATGKIYNIIMSIFYILCKIIFTSIQINSPFP